MIEVTEKDLRVLTRNREAMQGFLQSQEVTPDLLDDFHKCIETIGGILERAHASSERPTKDA
jgi:hypothetical protein